MLRKLIAGAHHFQSNVFANHREFFENLAEGQAPQGLFITCSDSRVNPNLITQTRPGELFIVRNIGNIVPPFAADCAAGATAAAIEYAVSQLNVDYIILCGHTRCGAMTGLLNLESVKSMPSVCGWLAHAESVRRVVRENYGQLDEESRLNVAVQENVLCQVENLRTHPAVAVRTARGDLKVCAWVYKLETGEVFAYNTESGQFASIHEQSPEPMRSARSEES